MAVLVEFVGNKFYWVRLIPEYSHVSIFRSMNDVTATALKVFVLAHLRPDLRPFVT
jgi:hypothetical protein